MSLEEQGIGKEEANETMLELYGLNVEDYVDAALGNVDVASMFAAFNYKDVYYVEDGKIYTALSWESKLFDDSEYTLNDNILIIDAMTIEDGGEPMQWEKAE